MDATPRVLIVDDHPLFRDALETALDRAFSGQATTRHAASLSDAKAALADGWCDLVLLDLTLPDASGFSGLSDLKGRGVDCPIVVVSATESDTAYAKARTLGAAGYLPKSMALDDLSAALVTCLDGGHWFPQTDDVPTNDMAERVSSLTPAQRKVLAGLSDGLLNKQIAFDMGISVATVKAHMTAIFRKLGANNRTQALLLYRGALSADDHSAA
ncbi:MAG: response regulator transcription factor [Pseudomonadota bacterium]